jgi:hypothetical protein
MRRNVPFDYAELIIQTFMKNNPNGRQIGQLFIDCHEGGTSEKTYRFLHIYVLASGLTIGMEGIHEVDLSNRVCVYSCDTSVANNILFNQWLREGPWQEDFYKLVEHLEKQLTESKCDNLEFGELQILQGYKRINFFDAIPSEGTKP